MPPSTERYTGIAPASHRNGRAGVFHRVAIARNRGNRGSVAARSAGSTNPPPWLATTSMGPSSGTCSRPVCSTVRNHPRVARRASTRTNTPRSEPIVGSSHDRSSLRWRREREGASGAGAVRADRTGRLHRRLGAGHGPPTRVLGGPRAHQRSRGPRRRQPSGHDRGVPRPRHGHGGVRCRPGGATRGPRDRPRNLPASAPR